MKALIYDSSNNPHLCRCELVGSQDVPPTDSYNLAIYVDDVLMCTVATPLSLSPLGQFYKYLERTYRTFSIIEGCSPVALRFIAYTLGSPRANIAELLLDGDEMHFIIDKEEIAIQTVTDTSVKSLTVAFFDFLQQHYDFDMFVDWYLCPLFFCNAERV